MNICILGANGRVGAVILNNSLEAGHTVTALVRNPNRITCTSSNLNWITGNALNESDLNQAIRNADIVFCALNTDGNSTLSKSMPLIIDSMKNNNINRIITIGTAGILQSRLEPGLYRYQSKESRNRSTIAAEDHLRAYHHLKDSNLDWTIICPTYLPEGKRIGQYRYEQDVLPIDGLSISVYDTGDFAYQQAFSNQFIHCRVGIAY
jgi:uncharacterized protein